MGQPTAISRHSSRRIQSKKAAVRDKVGNAIDHVQLRDALMPGPFRPPLVPALALLALGACSQKVVTPSPATTPQPAANVTAARLNSGEAEADQWFTAGRDANGTYY